MAPWPAFESSYLGQLDAKLPEGGYMEQTKRRVVSYTGLSGPRMVAVQFPQCWDFPEAAIVRLRLWDVPHEPEGAIIPFWYWVWLG